MADEPGDSIVDIKANYHYKDATVSGETSNHYVGYKIKKSDITVVGTDLNGNEKEIVDFTYSPTVLKAGKNTVEVMYTIADDISVNDYIYVNGEVPTMINLDAKHKGGNIYLDTLLDSNDFIVKATYEDGTVKAITGCSISPSEVKEGKNKITITKDGLSDIVEITAIDRETITENESEPNNEIKNADEIDVNVKYSGMLKENGDVDYYRLRIDKKGKIVIKLTHPKIDKSGDYWIVSLLSQSDNERVDLRASGTDAETNSSPVRVTPGTYYVKVSQYNFSDEKYTMTVLFDEEDDSYESEPNDDLSNQAMNINLDQEYTGNLTNEKDVDYFKFSISEKRKVWIDFLHDKTSQGRTLWKIALLDDSDGAILTFDSTGENAKLTSDSVRLAPGNYYIRINDYYWSDMDYTFCVHSEQEGSDTENEDNGDYGTATVATIGSSIVGNLQSKNDVDFYRFDLSEAVTIKVIFTHNQIDSEEVFWRFELHSVESSEPIENDENQEIMKIKGNSSQDVISVWSSLPVGTYYLKIYDYNYNNDDYGITLSY